MTQRSMFWDGASIGDANRLNTTTTDGTGYHMSSSETVSPFIDIMSRALWNGTGNRGVLYGWNNELEVTAPGGVSPIQIDTGAAIIYGLYYENTTALNKNITAPTNDTRYDLVVVRRSWTSQTARIYVIMGVEGGSIPGVTQSPAPSGSGIYDIPLASLAIDTVGNIVVTDAREFCVFPTGFADLSSTELANNSVEWEDRRVRYKRFFLGAGDLEPNVDAAAFTYDATWTYYYWSPSHFTQVGPPVWGGAANEEGWQCTGSATTYRGVYGTFRIPADYAGGAIYTYIWWVNNFVVAASFSWRTTFQVYREYSATNVMMLQGSRSTPISASGAISDVYRSHGITISGPFKQLGYTSSGSPTVYSPYSSLSSLSGGEVIHYYAAFYNTAGTEDVSILGIEFHYPGYT